MLGMDQVQRSNAVGASTSYLPSGDIGRDGGGTYTGQATEPTLQDYENFFGPSARDIKTDLQRFKRHGRWHLPDVLQGPNPWLTDRIDGLITDATNSPFTTKILPYRYKEDVDGKIKWNVWSFDEGMASRVPYESAARTLTQSKRSFAGYMVRQGMAIVLEHNFMMTPKGRENFKNQLNQLIGSIQYTNDLDVHMALILAPSYQKTMRERYYSTDKSAAQLCREHADLFGMMQKNVNALDILIEEGKAILRTWGGPMPDFLLCNSKLTFQMTMTPEKTNYITQGIDGVKRLRQGPDLGSYRNLSIVHTRSFAMETGQHPRDVLRRRVRTAEYYRIAPDARNVNREFEFYNEERDNWFTLSFQDLLRCARYRRMDGGDNDNASRIDIVYHGLSAEADDKKNGGALQRLQAAPSQMGMLGAYFVNEIRNIQMYNELMDTINDAGRTLNNPIMHTYNFNACDLRHENGKHWWVFHGLFYRMGVRYIEPIQNEVWDNFKLTAVYTEPNGFGKFSLGVNPLNQHMLDEIYSACKNLPLNDPFRPSRVVAAGSGEWFTAYLFYLECIKRKGLPLQLLTSPAGAAPVTNNDEACDAMQNLNLTGNIPQSMDISAQYLGLHGAVGCANHPLHLHNMRGIDPNYQRVLETETCVVRLTRRVLITNQLLELLLSKFEMTHNGVPMIGLNVLEKAVDSRPDAFNALFASLIYYNAVNGFLEYNLQVIPLMIRTIANVLGQPGIRIIERASTVHFARYGISTIPMFITTMGHLCRDNSCQANTSTSEFRALAASSGGQLSEEILRELQQAPNALHPFAGSFNGSCTNILAVTTAGQYNAKDFLKTLRSRLFDDPLVNVLKVFAEDGTQLPPDTQRLFGTALYDRNLLRDYIANARNWNGPSTMSEEAMNVVIDLNRFFDDEPVAPLVEAPRAVDRERAKDVEIVIVRPNIEHNMLGVIMGLGGNELGNTLWGQTELSVYDDSMHGIWGMSYKYHERAIVFNEKNLIRMWDIAYDGYNGGKDDTYVDWTEEGAPNGFGSFKEATLNLGKNYRGPSMMVMAFVHDRSKLTNDGRHAYNQHFRRNWPSPVVFYDSYNPGQGRAAARETLPIDYDNVQTVDVEEFRVFNNELYAGAYKDYRELMPDFRSLHVTRKSAGQSSADAETGADCLAFQGSMRIKEGGVVVQDIQGSGHHGPDYVGVASVRAGKGQKVAGQQPTLHRLI